MKLIFPANLAQAKRKAFEPEPENVLAQKGADYVHPREVVQDDRLAPAEKRAILSAWASDACAVEAKPGFRWLRGTPGPILVDHVLAALRSLDDMSRLPIPQRDGTARLAAGRTRHGQLLAQIAKRGSAREASTPSA